MAPRCSRAARRQPHRRRDSGLACLLVAWPRGLAVPAKGSPTADAADPRGRPVGRASRRRARGHGRGRRRRAPGHGRPLPFRRRRLRGGRRAGVGLLRPRCAGPWSGRAGHRAALRGREPAAGRPVVVRRAALGRPRPGDPRRGLRRGAAGAGADPRAGEEGPDLPRDELGDQSLRLRGACDRQQRRPQRRPPRPHRARVSRRRLGRHHPAVQLPGQGRQAPDLPGLQLERGRAGDLRERLRAADAADAQAGGSPILECVEQLDGGKYLAHWGYENKNGTTVEATGDQNSFSPAPADRGQPKAFAAGRVEDRFQVEFNGSELTWSLTGNKASGEQQLEEVPRRLDHGPKRLVPESDPGRFDLRIDGEVGGGAAAVGDGGSTGTIAVATGSRTVSETAAPGT